MSGRAKCDVCGKKVKADPDGTPRRHRTGQDRDGVKWVVPCPGSPDETMEETK